MVKKDKASKLIELIAQKGDDADVLITVDVARLEQAREKGILQPIESEVITGRQYRINSEDRKTTGSVLPNVIGYWLTARAC